MPRYGHDYGDRGFPAGPRGRHWLGDRYDATDYHGWERPGLDRGREMERGRGWGPPRERGFGGGSRYGQVDYRGGYGPPYRSRGDYSSDYGYRRYPDEERWYGRRPAREEPFHDWGPEYGYGFEGESYGDYGLGMFRGGGLFRSARGGGVAPGQYFRGYGIGSAGSYEPY